MAARVRAPYPAIAQHPTEPVDIPGEIPVPNIVVKHPGYPVRNTLFILPACDGPAHNQAYWEAVFTAGAIVANNRFDGWLASNASGSQRISADERGLIDAGLYFFCVPTDPCSPSSSNDATPSSPAPYPVVPNFRVWRFPHDHRPVFWHNNTLSRLNSAPPVFICLMTACTLALDKAHVIPRTEADWFLNNDMSRYGDIQGVSGERRLHGNANSIYFRTDIHRIWDSGRFSIIPRKKEDGSYVWATLALSNDGELLRLYNNVELQATWVPPEYFFARFAYAIFPQVMGFLEADRPRVLAAVDAESDEIRVDQYTLPQRARFMQDQGRTRSGGSRKRPHTDTPAASEECADYDALDDPADQWNGADSAVFGLVGDSPSKPYTYGDETTAFDMVDNDDFEERGRKRQRFSG